MIESRSFTLPLRCSYLLKPGHAGGGQQPVILALHGYAMTPEEMLRLTEPLVGDGCTIAALRGPHQVWINGDEPTRRRAAFHWGTNFEPQHARRVHHDIVATVIRELDVPASRVVLLGFSQSVSFNYRFVCTYPDAACGVIGICGGLPGDWDEAPYKSTTAAALHIATREDRWYSPEVTGQYPERLRRRFAEVEFHLLDGAHRMPSTAGPMVREWLERIVR